MNAQEQWQLSYQFGSVLRMAFLTALFPVPFQLYQLASTLSEEQFFRQAAQQMDLGATCSSSGNLGRPSNSPNFV